jgi:hypothetical protein
MDASNPVWKKVLLGPNKYNVGLVFLFANMMGFITNMRKIDIPDHHAVMILLSLFILARLVV